MQVSFGSQRRRTKIARLKDKAFTWNQGLAFAATVPMKERTFKLLLCEVDRQNQKSRLLAIAFIRLSKLWAMGGESGTRQQLSEGVLRALQHTTAAGVLLSSVFVFELSKYSALWIGRTCLQAFDPCFSNPRFSVC